MKRYIGVTDEPLWEEGRVWKDQYRYPKADAVFASPMLRCLQTAGLIYPEQPPIILEGFRECNFGEFENRNYKELSSNPAYQAWIDSNGKMPFPAGEDPAGFKSRCVRAFRDAMEESMLSGYRTVALVVHGGTIMSILEALAIPRRDYYQWQVKNGGGYISPYDEQEGRLTNPCIIPLSPL